MEILKAFNHVHKIIPLKEKFETRMFFSRKVRRCEKKRWTIKDFFKFVKDGLGLEEF